MKFITHYLITFSSLVITTVFALFNQSIISRVLTVEERGEYAFSITAITISGALLIFGLDRALQVSVNRGLIKFSNGLKQLLIFSTVIFLISAVAYIITIRIYPQYIAIALPSMLLLPLLALNTGLTLFLCGNGAFITDGICRIATQLIVSIIITTLFLVYHQISVQIVLWTQVVSYILTCAYSAFSMVTSNAYRPFPLAFNKKVFHFGLSFFPARFFNVIRTNIVLILLGIIGNKYEVGMISIALSIVAMVNMIPSTVNMVFQPHVSKSADGCPRLVFNFSAMLGLFSSALVTILVFLVPFGIPILFGHKYIPANTPTLILMAFCITESISTPIITYFVGISKPIVLSYYSALQTVMTLLFMLLLYPSTGMLSASLAISISGMVSLVFLLTIFIRTCNIGWHSLASGFFLFTLSETDRIVNQFKRLSQGNFKNKTGKNRTISQSSGCCKIEKQFFDQNEASFEAAYIKQLEAVKISNQHDTCRAPEIYHIDHDKRNFSMELIAGKRLYDITLREEDSISIGQKLGKSMAIFHHKMALPEKYHIHLAQPFNQCQGFSQVVIHGDFSPVNIILDKTGKPVIIDWNCSDIFGGVATVGPGIYDVSFFVIMCLLPSRHTPGELAMAKAFMREYMNYYDISVLSDDMRRYFMDMANHLVFEMTKFSSIDYIKKQLRHRLFKNLVTLFNQLSG